MRKHVDHLISQLATSPQENSEIISGKAIEAGIILLIDQVAAVIFVKSIKVSDLGTYYSTVKDRNTDLTVENLNFKIHPLSLMALVKKWLLQLKYSK